MTAPAITVAPDAPVDDIARLMLARRISGVPVVEAGRLVGIVSEGDLVRHVGAVAARKQPWWLAWLADRNDIAQEYAKSHGRTAADVMTRKVVTVTENTALDKVATLLERNRIKRVPVVRRGKVVGIVSRANLLHGLVAQKAPVRGAVVKDRDIRARILDEVDSAGIDKAYVNVVVANGGVELWGTVESEAQRRALVLAAQGTNGVKRVVNNVAVVSAARRGAGV